VGVSAYRGKNSETGRLAEFKEAVRTGLVPVGSYLLVESLDRISRQAARKAFRVLEDICEEGITVVTMSDGKAYTAKSLDTDPMSLMMALLIFIRSNEESATKGRRLKEVWAKKRRTASEGPLTARGPAWLSLGPDRKWQVDREKANVVRRIFRMAASGHGQHHIAEALNGDNVPTFGDGGRRPGKHWHRSYIARLLSNHAVVGTLVPHTVDYAGGRRERVAQAPVKGYYPAIVKSDLFEKVRSLALEKHSPKRGRHAHTEVQNILGGLARCPVCSGTMTRVTKGSRAKAGKPYLVCAKAKAGAGCEYRSVKLESVESCLVKNAGHLLNYVPAAPDGDDLQIKLRNVETNIDATNRTISKLLDAISHGPSAALRQRLRESEADLEALQAREKELWDRISATHGPLLEARLAPSATPWKRSLSRSAMPTSP